MASFDFVDSSSKAYRFIWQRRAEVLRLSAMVLSIKILCFVGFVVFGIQNDILRQGLYLLPSYLLEGWVIAQIMVMALYAEQAEGSKSVLPPSQDVSSNIKASMIVYVLMKLMLSFVVGSSFPGGVPLSESAPPEPDASTFIVAVMMIVFLIWSFRFIWVYVPYVMGLSPLDYLRRFKAFSSSFYMLGVWVLCFVPLVLVMILASEVLALFMIGIGVEGKSVVFNAGLAVIQAFMDYSIALVSSLGIAYGIYSVLNGENKKTPLF